MIFRAIGMTYINYCSILISNCNRTSLSKLSTKYNHCGATIFNCYINSIMNYDWPDLNKILFNQNCLYIHNIVHHNYAPNLLNIFTTADRPYNFRQQLCYIDRKSKKIGQHSFDYWAPKLWNTLPANIKSINNINSFKLLLNNIN